MLRLSISLQAHLHLIQEAMTETMAEVRLERLILDSPTTIQIAAFGNQLLFLEHPETDLQEEEDSILQAVEDSAHQAVEDSAHLAAEEMAHLAVVAIRSVMVTEILEDMVQEVAEATMVVVDDLVDLRVRTIEVAVI
jgi:hypothetical protein